ncbi:MAG TPA: hypothetical protein VFL04_04040, partial [Rectinemataceae bacterium]|nr:hypothetical protein [Rectinemataceae bacterium]
MSEADGAGWKVGRSIILELDLAISIACARAGPGLGTGEIAALVAGTPARLRREFVRMFGEPRRLHATMEAAALAAGVLEEDDIEAAAGAMRGLDLAGAVAALEDLRERRGIAGQAADAPAGTVTRSAVTLSPVARPPAGTVTRFVEAYVHLKAALYAELGFAPASLGPLLAEARVDAERGALILAGGREGEAFWPWLDRFHSEVYLPWRQGREEAMLELERRASSELGAPERGTGIPPTAWLSEKNPLLRFGELGSSLREGSCRPLFWAEPFGIADLWVATPTGCIVSIAGPGPAFEAFLGRFEEAARKVQAIADPTRLVMLCLIRQIGMTNSDMAAYLGIARP